MCDLKATARIVFTNSQASSVHLRGNKSRESSDLQMWPTWEWPGCFPGVAQLFPTSSHSLGIPSLGQDCHQHGHWDSPALSQTDGSCLRLPQWRGLGEGTEDSPRGDRKRVTRVTTAMLCVAPTPVGDQAGGALLALCSLGTVGTE